MVRRFEFMEHTADALFRAYGSTLEEAFEAAAQAMFNVMLDTSQVNPTEAYTINVESETIEGLLVEFLEELLFVFEVEGLVFSDFDVSIEIMDGLKLSGAALGEGIDPERHRFSVDIKAVTYHQLYVKETDEGYEAQVLVDI